MNFLFLFSIQRLTNISIEMLTVFPFKDQYFSMMSPIKEIKNKNIVTGNFFIKHS